MILDIFKKGKSIGSRVIKETTDGFDYISNGGPLAEGKETETPSSFSMDATFYPTSEGIEHLENEGEHASAPLRIMMSSNQTPRVYANLTLQGGYQASPKQLQQSIQKAMQEGWISNDSRDAAL